MGGWRGRSLLGSRLYYVLLTELKLGIIICSLTCRKLHFMENFEFFQFFKFFWADFPFTENSYLPVYFYFSPDSSELVCCCFHWTDEETPFSFQYHTQSKATPPYFVLCRHSLPAELGVESPPGWPHSSSSSIFVLICVEHMAAQAAVNCFTGAACGYNEGFQDWALLLFPLWVRGRPLRE